MHLNGEFFWKVDVLKTFESKVIILTSYVLSNVAIGYK